MAGSSRALYRSPSPSKRRQKTGAKTFRLTRLLALSGETHAGRSFAASMSRNSPSVSRMLQLSATRKRHELEHSWSGRSYSPDDEL